MANLGELSLFISAFLAATILPFSSEASLIIAITAGMTPFKALIIASFGNVLAIILNYFIGYKLSNYAHKQLNSKIGKKAFYLSEKYGYYSLLFSWLPIIGDPITLIAGLSKLKFWYFFIVVATLRVARYYLIIFAIS
ncbi:MAG: DedA family protein [Helicobacteraceae bacterium]|nr:DedA family protein [Helicobacteraceae bacterium]